MKKIIFFFISYAFLSCNQEHIAELEAEKEELENKISYLEEQIEILNNENEELKISNSQMLKDMRNIQIYANSASSHASSASFWSDCDDLFFFQSKLRSMSSDFNNIVEIASKY